MRFFRRPYPFVINKASPQWNGLVAWCPLGTGSLHQDLAKRGVDAVAVNGPALGSAPDHGSVMNFISGSDQYINLGNPASLQITGELTISFWYRLTSEPANTSAFQLVAKDKDSGGRAFSVDVFRNDVAEGTSGVRFWINGGSVSLQNIVEEGLLPVSTVGQARHVVARYRPSDGGSALKLFINGQLEATSNTADGSINSATANVLIGRREYSGFEEPLNGAIWDARIYNRALTDAEVWSLYAPETRWQLYGAPKRIWDAPAAGGGGGGTKTLFWWSTYGQVA